MLVRKPSWIETKDQFNKPIPWLARGFSLWSKNIVTNRALAQSFNRQPVETDPEKQKRYSKRNIDAQAMLDWGKRSIQ